MRICRFSVGESLQFRPQASAEVCQLPAKLGAFQGAGGTRDGGTVRRISQDRQAKMLARLLNLSPPPWNLSPINAAASNTAAIRRPIGPVPPRARPRAPSRAPPAAGAARSAAHPTKLQAGPPLCRRSRGSHGYGNAPTVGGRTGPEFPLPLELRQDSQPSAGNRSTSLNRRG